MSGAVPKLRFPGFRGEWETTSMQQILVRASEPVTLNPSEIYREIGVRSHGKGIFHKDPTLGAELGSKRVFKVIPDALVLNIVFAWEQAVAMTSSDDVGFIASHRFPMFLAKSGKAYLPFVLSFFLTATGKSLLELASPGGAGRNKTLGQHEFLKLSARFPDEPEQRKIADFLAKVDAKLEAMRRKYDDLRTFKAGLMQKLFSQEIRFTRDDGSEFPDWEERRLGEIGIFLKGKGVSKADISEGGNLPCIRYGEIYTRYGERITEVSSATNVPAGDLVLSQARDVIIPASGETPIDMARACCVLMSGVAIGGDINVFRGEMNGEFLAYFLTNGRRQEIAQMAQGNSVVHLYPSQLRKIMISIPHPDEQRKIADALTALDTKITAVQSQITEMEAFKKGLLQQMFV